MPRWTVTRRTTFLILLAAIAWSCDAPNSTDDELRVARLVADHMVLQRETPIAV